MRFVVYYCGCHGDGSLSYEGCEAQEEAARLVGKPAVDDSTKGRYGYPQTASPE
jgi:hypothetical protein